MPETISPRALATLAEVKLRAGEKTADHDEDWTRLLNAASDEIHTYANREFVATNATGTPDNRTVDLESRYFDVDEATVDERELLVGDMAEPPSLVKVYEYDGTTLRETVPSAAMVMLPRRRKPWQPIDTIRFLDGLANVTCPTLARRYVIEVRSRWGFPQVPEAINHATIVQTAIWFQRDVRRYAKTFSLEEGRIERPRALAEAIREIVDHFRVPAVG